MEKRLTNQIQTFPPVFEVLTDKGKPSERVGRKATDLNPVRSNFNYLKGHGGWVAEVGFRPLLTNKVGVRLLAVGFKSHKEVAHKCAPIEFRLNGRL